MNLHRSGSSMLMRCLEAGGLDPVYDKLSDAMNHSAPSDYVPNPNGFYQFTGEVNEAFPILYNNKLVKFPIRYLNNLPDSEYKIIILKRDPEEIRMSMSKWTPYSAWGPQESATYLYDEIITGIKDRLSKLNNVSVIEVNYRDIVNNPLDTFNYIKESGWEINVEACVSMVDSSLYRNKLEKDK